MAQTKYRKIYGCPKHGTINGTTAVLKTNNNGIEVKKSCYRCETCKKVYLEPDNGTLGDTKHRVQNYAIWNTVGPIEFLFWFCKIHINIFYISFRQINISLFFGCICSIGLTSK